MPIVVVPLEQSSIQVEKMNVKNVKSDQEEFMVTREVKKRRTRRCQAVGLNGAGVELRFKQVRARGRVSETLHRIHSKKPKANSKSNLW